MSLNVYNLTQPQEAIWNTERFYLNTSINTISGRVIINSKFNRKLLEKAINLFVQTTKGIRYQFDINNDIVTQYEKKYEPFSVDFIKLCSTNEKDILNSISRKVFNLYNSPLYYFAIFETESKQGGFFVCVHHIISDAWSMSLLVNSIMSIYSKLLKNEELTFSDSYNYSDFIEQEKTYLSSSRFNKDKSFWNELFNENIFDNSFSGNVNTMSAFSTNASRAEFKLSSTFTKKIVDFCKEIKVSPFTFILFIMGIYEGKINQTDKVVLSTPILNRSSAKEKNTFGLFVNNMLYKLNIDYNTSFYECIDELNKNQFSYLRHQKYPSQNLVSDIKNRFNIKENIYNTSVSYQNARMNHSQDNIDYSTEWFFNGFSSIPLVLHIYDMDDTKSFSFIYDYQNCFYDYSQIKDIHNRLRHICEQVINDRNILIKDIQLITDEEKNLILDEFNNTSLKYDSSKTIIDLFQEQAISNPEKIAIICDNKSITFKDLDIMSNQFAGFLQKKYNLTVDNNISIILDRSIDLIITILSILKCGCSYVLIDPSHPSDRKKYMIENSNSKYVISNLDLDIDIDNLIHIDNISNMNIHDKYTIPNFTSDDNMYLLYTSGSTGNPKAVTITHKNFHNYLLGISQAVNYSSEKIVLSMASISFDVFGYELWVTILNSLTLVLSNSEEQHDFSKLNELILKYNVNILYGTPSKILSLMSSDNSKASFKLLTDIGIGGESLNQSFLNNLNLITSANIYNMYGPTETTVGCCCKKLSKNSKVITIGKPLSNVKFYVLDNNLNLCPPCIKGELYISGDGVSKGYFGRDDLTKKCFLPDIFNPKYTMYKSGDIVSWTKQGELIFHGRADSQIKIRGYRIELSEIENVLIEHQFIKSCAVINYTYNGRDFLCAYYTSDFTIQNYELKIFLSKKLPYYMIPSYFIALPSLPLNVNGKIDRKKLPSPFKFTKNEKYVKPETELQKEICKALESCLSIKNIGIYEDFSNLGIDSLSIIQMQSKLSALNISVPTQYFYDYSNVKELCFALENTNSKNGEDFSNDNYPFMKHDLSNLSIKKHEFKNILLTGCTGFLGIHILDILLNKNCTIYCLVRSSSEKSARKRIISMFNFYFKNKYSEEFLFSKIKVVVGDITYDNLGLSDKLFNELGNIIDLVIHSAALVKHMGKYEEFEKMNLNGTKNVAAFCMKYKIFLNHISTISVSGDFMPLNSTTLDVDYTEEDFFIGQSYSENYYIKSKLLTEEFLLDNIKKGLLNANIYRIGNLTARRSDGVFQYNIDSNAFYNKLQFILKNKLYYESSIVQNFDMSPVDDVATAIIGIIYNYGSQNKVFHVFNPYKFNMKSLIDMLNDLNYNIKIVTDDQFYKRISKMNLDSNSLVISDYSLYTNISYLNIKTKCDITLKYLEKFGFKYDKIDSNYLLKLIQYISNLKM